MLGKPLLLFHLCSHGVKAIERTWEAAPETDRRDRDETDRDAE